MSWYDLIEWWYESCLTSKFFIPAVCILLIIAIILIVIICKRKHVSVKEISIGKFTVKINRTNIDVAYKIYIQLKTRKVANVYKENDVIDEIYKSWYTAFNNIRELLLSIDPIPQNIELIKLGEYLLNDLMRPHLTRWQSKYRKWYVNACNKNTNESLTPQEIESRYPDYYELIEDMKKSQEEIKKFLGDLKKLFS